MVNNLQPDGATCMGPPSVGRGGQPCPRGGGLVNSLEVVIVSPGRDGMQGDLWE